MKKRDPLQKVPLIAKIRKKHQIEESIIGFAEALSNSGILQLVETGLMTYSEETGFKQLRNQSLPSGPLYIRMDLPAIMDIQDKRAEKYAHDLQTGLNNWMGHAQNLGIPMSDTAFDVKQQGRSIYVNVQPLIESPTLIADYDRVYTRRLFIKSGAVLAGGLLTKAGINDVRGGKQNQDKTQEYKGYTEFGTGAVSTAALLLNMLKGILLQLNMGIPNAAGLVYPLSNSTDDEALTNFAQQIHTQVHAQERQR